MLLLLHALIPCVATYILSFGLHILLLLYALIPVLLHIYLVSPCPCFSTFWHCHP